MLAEIFYLLRDMHDPARIGAGLDPSPAISDFAKGLVHDQNTDRKLAEFTERWIRDPRWASASSRMLALTDLADVFRLAVNIPVQLNEISQVPPAQTRKDSPNFDMLKEVAALERELIKPDHHQPDPSAFEQGSTPVLPDSSMQVPTGSSILTADTQADLSGGMPPASANRPLASSTSSPFPVTFRSPAFLASQTEDPPATPIDFPVLPTLTIEPSQLTIQPLSEKVESSASPNSKGAAILPPAYPTDFIASLPPLPESLVKSRLAIGGLAKKKARERAAAQANPQSASTLGPTNSDLYKLGVSKATHCSVRSLIGAGAPQAGKTRTGGKVILTSDWHVAIQEMQTLKAMERIEQLKADKSWSLRQLRKQRAPGTQKAHWDYLLEEMRWMAIDYKQETRWKIATAAGMVKEVMQWHRADSKGKKDLQVVIRRPDIASFGPNETTPRHAEVVSVTPDLSLSNAAVPSLSEAADMNMDGPKDLSKAEQTKDGLSTEETDVPASPVSKAPIMAVTAESTTAALSMNPDAPRQKRHQHSLMRIRAPIFDMPPSMSVFDLSKSQSQLPDAYNDVSTYDLVNELFQELPLYGPPVEPSNDPRQNRRIDEASPTYARITNPSYMLESKPLLISTLHPSRKRNRSGGWLDLLDLAGDDSKDTMSEMFASTQGT